MYGFPKPIFILDFLPFHPGGFSSLNYQRSFLPHILSMGDRTPNIIYESWRWHTCSCANFTNAHFSFSRAPDKPTMASTISDTDLDELLSESCRSSGSTPSARMRSSGRPSANSPPAAAGAASQTLQETDTEATLSYYDATTASEASTDRSATRRLATSGARGRNWCFTLNNPTDPERAHLLSTLHEMRIVRFLVFQLETGESGTPHFQGYIEFREVVRRNRVKSMISPMRPGHPHTELRLGTQEQAVRYCQKEEGRLEGPWEFGTPGSRNRGKRTDLDILFTKLKEGVTDYELLDDPKTFKCAIRHSRGIQRWREVCTLPRAWKSEVWVIVGPADAGKTSWVRDHPDNQPWDTGPEGRGKGWSDDIPDQFFNGYAGEEACLFDEMCGSLYKFGYMLKLLDRYSMRVPTKGSYCQWIPRRIYLCSNFWPDTWYKVGNWAAFQRRVDHWCYKTVPPNRDYTIDTVRDFGRDYEAFMAMKAEYDPPLPAVDTFRAPQDLDFLRSN